MALSRDALSVLHRSYQVNREMLAELRSLRRSSQADTDMRRRFVQDARQQQQGHAHEQAQATNHPLQDAINRQNNAFAAHSGGILPGGEGAKPPEQTNPSVTQAARQQSGQQGQPDQPQDQADQSQGSATGSSAGVTGAAGAAAGVASIARNIGRRWGSGQNTTSGAASAAAGGTGGGRPPSGGGQPPAGGSGGSGGTFGRLLGGIPFGGAIGGALDAVGVGAVLKGVSNVFGIYGSQRDKNDYYRSIEGGGHGNALKERATEEVYSLKNRLFMSSADARQLFTGITRMGFTDQNTGGYNRGDLMAFGVQAKRRRGQDASETMQQLSTWLDNGAVSLREFQNALDGVSKTARTAGVNTQMARTQMQTYMDLATSKGVGSGAAKLGQALTNAQMGGGRALASQLDASGSLSMSVTAMEAAGAGMSIGQFEVEREHNTKTYYEAANRQNRLGWQTVIPPEDVRWAKQYHKEHPQASSQRAGQAFADQVRIDTGMPLEFIARQISSLTGEDASDPIALMGWVFNQINGMQQVSPDSKKVNPGKQGPANGKKRPDPVAMRPHTPLSQALQGNKTKGRGGTSLTQMVKDPASTKQKPLSTKSLITIPGADQQPGPGKHTPSGYRSPMQQAIGNVKVKIDATPDAKRLIKAMVVTGGDPYSGANAASSGRPPQRSGHPTR